MSGRRRKALVRQYREEHGHPPSGAFFDKRWQFHESEQRRLKKQYLRERAGGGR